MSAPDNRDDWVELAEMAELGVMTASLVHELRQPIFAVKAIAQMGLANGGTVDEEWLRELLQQVEHMEQLVSYYNGFGRNKEHEPATVYDLNASARSALNMLQHRSKKLGADLAQELTERSLLIQGREAAARQIVVNLLQNALDAVEAEPDRRVIVRTRVFEGVARLEIEDSGPGVPEALRERIFEPFVTTKPRGRGTGLGLYIARRLVDEGNGSLRVHFPDSGGTRVEVDLPLVA